MKTLQSLAARGIDTSRWESAGAWQATDGMLHGNPHQGPRCGQVRGTLMKTLPSTTDELCWCWAEKGTVDVLLQEEILELWAVEAEVQRCREVPGRRSEHTNGKLYEHHATTINHPEVQNWWREMRSEVQALLQPERREEPVEMLLVLNHWEAARTLTHASEPAQALLLSLWDPQWREEMVIPGSRNSIEKLIGVLTEEVSATPSSYDWADAPENDHSTLEVALALSREGIPLPEALEAAGRIL